jgi:hypothetical protein
VIGVQMGVYGLDQLEVEFTHKLEIAIDPFQDGIDDQRLAATAAVQEIAGCRTSCRRAGGRSWLRLLRGIVAGIAQS